MTQNFNAGNIVFKFKVATEDIKRQLKEIPNLVEQVSKNAQIKFKVKSPTSDDLSSTNLPTEHAAILKRAGISNVSNLAKFSPESIQKMGFKPEDAKKYVDAARKFEEKKNQFDFKIPEKESKKLQTFAEKMPIVGRFFKAFGAGGAAAVGALAVAGAVAFLLAGSGFRSILDLLGDIVGHLSDLLFLKMWPLLEPLINGLVDVVDLLSKGDIFGVIKTILSPSNFSELGNIIGSTLKSGATTAFDYLRDQQFWKNVGETALAAFILIPWNFGIGIAEALGREFQGAVVGALIGAVAGFAGGGPLGAAAGLIIGAIMGPAITNVLDEIVAKLNEMDLSTTAFGRGVQNLLGLKDVDLSKEAFGRGIDNLASKFKDFGTQMAQALVDKLWLLVEDFKNLGGQIATAIKDGLVGLPSSIVKGIQDQLANWRPWSDGRLKTDVSTVAGLAVVRALRGVEFKWRETGARDYGFIAQEVEGVVPGVVGKAEDEQETRFLPYEKLVPFLVEAVKELTAQVTDLKAELAKETT